MVKKPIRRGVTWFAENQLATLIVGVLGLGFSLTIGIAVPILGVISFPISAVMIVSAILGWLD